MMTPVERSLGRFMRAPDGHDGGDGGAGGEGGAGNDGDAAAAGGEGAQGAAGDQGAGDQGGADSNSIIGSADQSTAEGEGDGDGDGDGSAETVPEAYELKLVTKTTGDDGAEVETAVEMDPALVEAATPVLKGLGLTNAQANQLVPLAVKVQERLTEQMADAHATQVAEWAQQAKADPELGGKNWQATVGNVAKALDRFVGPATVTAADGSETRDPFRALLDDTGLGNHPVLIRALAKIGAAIGEDDQLLRGDAGAQITKSRAEVMYPNMTGASE